MNTNTLEVQGQLWLQGEFKFIVGVGYGSSFLIRKTETRKERREGRRRQGCRGEGRKGKGRKGILFRSTGSRRKAHHVIGIKGITALATMDHEGEPT